VLKVTAANGSSNCLADDELNSKLLALARDRGLKSVYYVQTMGRELTPRLLYRVKLDGTHELVRGAVLDDIDQRAMRSGLAATGEDLFVANYFGDVAANGARPCIAFWGCHRAPRQREERQAAGSIRRRNKAGIRDP